ncbi:DNA-binding protein [Cryobacterium arcticum]|uniref:DNA-binding protein n=2 Tax=Cryobacterium arcticum TaxID=670052 RepID=A0A1B1BLT6_9MICO|nr:DNA-binding protein [Cryobacterium arcticum]
MHGTLTSWDDDRGFGFITPSEGTGKTFVHIKAFPARPTRPQLGEALTFEVEHEPGGKSKATRVRPAGQREQPTGQRGRPAGQRMPSSAQRPASRKRSGAALYLPILLFVLGYLVVNALWPIPLWVAGIYLVASIVCFVFYAADKSAAGAGRWRISETTLLLWGVVGGWPGAIVAQQTLRHKTQKVSFRRAFWGSVVVNLIVFAVFATPVFALVVEWTKRSLR